VSFFFFFLLPRSPRTERTPSLFPFFFSFPSLSFLGCYFFSFRHESLCQSTATTFRSLFFFHGGSSIEEGGFLLFPFFFFPVLLFGRNMISPSSAQRPEKSLVTGLSLPFFLQWIVKEERLFVFFLSFPPPGNPVFSPPAENASCLFLFPGRRWKSSHESFFSSSSDPFRSPFLCRGRAPLQFPFPVSASKRQDLTPPSLFFFFFSGFFFSFLPE